MNDEALPTPCLREAAFDLFGAELPDRPVILSVPHAGRDYPPALLDALNVPIASEALFIATSIAESSAIAAIAAATGGNRSRVMELIR